MPLPNPKRLLVEGDEDKRVIPQFMESFIPWGNTPATRPVEIVSHTGVEDLLEPGNLSAEMKTPGLQILGVIADADSDAKKRWNWIRNEAVGELPNLPTHLPPEGLIYQQPKGIKFGVWIMPDNVSSGMMETFLSLFIDDPTSGLWPFVVNHCRSAKALHGATYKDVHLDKSLIHSWLAINDPVGCQLHIAILTKILQPASPRADPFVNWFRKLFEV